MYVDFVEVYLIFSQTNNCSEYKKYKFHVFFFHLSFEQKPSNFYSVFCLSLNSIYVK